MSDFFGSDEFITGITWGFLIALVLIIPAEALADWWRNRGRDS